LALADEAQYKDIPLFVLSVEGLIAAKKAANRPKDQPGLAALYAVKAANDEIARGRASTSSSDQTAEPNPAQT
jgi:hypothetical protein